MLPDLSASTHRQAGLQDFREGTERYVVNSQTNRYNIVGGNNLTLGFAAIFFIAALKPREKHHWFYILGGWIFVLLRLSELYEARTGAWWKPWWLILWKSGCGAAFVPMFLWYRKIKKSKSQTDSITDDRDKQQGTNSPI